MNELTCNLCDQLRKPRHDRPGKFFTLCADHYAEYQRQKNRESYARHREDRVERARKYREENPEKARESALRSQARPEARAAKRAYMIEYLRPYRKYVKDACERCGWEAEESRQLDVHHRDGNRKNNDPSNLETLCPPCHRVVDHSLLNPDDCSSVL